MIAAMIAVMCACTSILWDWDEVVNAFDFNGHGASGELDSCTFFYDAYYDAEHPATHVYYSFDNGLTYSESGKMTVKDDETVHVRVISDALIDSVKIEVVASDDTYTDTPTTVANGLSSTFTIKVPAKYAVESPVLTITYR